ncbi:hypothetical protein VP01_801g4 [Puccinia sorghi]|uniref:Uncharacterized protein n=1 Tax=Puccinia sorghi TaxID=27349 RepID=A0A0L6UAJ1_9BASI|nr:hypothetical protein VP01_801g4 [Puccinia sorghi]
MNVSSNNLLIKPQKWNKSIPEDVARFLLTNDGLSKAMIGGYLGESIKNPIPQIKMTENTNSNGPLTSALLRSLYLTRDAPIATACALASHIQSTGLHILNSAEPLALEAVPSHTFCLPSWHVTRRLERLRTSVRTQRKLLNSSSSYLNLTQSPSSSTDGGIIIQAGQDVKPSWALRKFSQTFLLAKQPNDFFMLKDIFG